MIRRNMIFFAHGDCGCAGSATTYSRTNGCDTGVVPATGTVVADNRYFGLATAGKGQLLIVPKGSNAQHFLASDARKLVFIGSTGEAEPTDSPALSLPVLNPPAGNVYPMPGGFKFLQVGSGSSPVDWMHVAAPTTGTWILQSKNGSFQLVDAGQIPGLNEVGGAATFSSHGVPMMIQEDPDNPGSYVVRKLQVIHERLVQGWVDPDTGQQFYRPIPTTAQLKHQRGHFVELQLGTYQQVGPLGNIIPGGMEQALAFGAGAITDGFLVWYSPEHKKFFRIPKHTNSFNFKNTNDAFANVPANWTALPGGHMISANPININYPTVRIDGQVSFGGEERAIFALFRDGNLIQEFNVNITADCTFFYVEENVPLGPHFWEFRWKKQGAGTGGGSIRFSAVQVTTQF